MPFYIVTSKILLLKVCCTYLMKFLLLLLGKKKSNREISRWVALSSPPISKSNNWIPFCIILIDVDLLFDQAVVCRCKGLVHLNCYFMIKPFLSFSLLFNSKLLSCKKLFEWIKTTYYLPSNSFIFPWHIFFNLIFSPTDSFMVISDVKITALLLLCDLWMICYKVGWLRTVIQQKSWLISYFLRCKISGGVFQLWPPPYQ